MISYAQNFEDVILNRVLRDVGAGGHYIDIGAQDPVLHSVSLAFYEKGWRGVHVEPNEAFAQKLRDARPDEEVLAVAVGLGEGPISFYEIPDTGLSTGLERNAREAERAGHRVRRVSVPVLPLSRVLDSYRERDIHWLKIDAEGMERQIIESWEPSNVRPWVVVVESLEPVLGSTDADKLTTTHEAWEPTLLRLGYEFVYFDGLNRFYLSNAKSDLRHRFSSGPCVFDDFELPAWSHHLRTVGAQLNALRASESELSKNLKASRTEAGGLTRIVSRQSSALEGFGLELQTLRGALNAAQAALAAEQAARQRSEAARQRASQAATDALAAEREKTLSEAKARQILSEELWRRDQLIAAHRQASEEAARQTSETIKALQKKKRRSRKAHDRAAHERDALLNSASWRITAPMRAVGKTVRRLVKSVARTGRGTRDALAMTPGSGTRRVAKSALRNVAAAVRKVPVVREIGKAIVVAIPPLQQAVRVASAPPPRKSHVRGKLNRKRPGGYAKAGDGQLVAVPLDRGPARQLPTVSKHSRRIYWITRAMQSRNSD